MISSMLSVNMSSKWFKCWYNLFQLCFRRRYCRILWICWVYSTYLWCFGKSHFRCLGIVVLSHLRWLSLVLRVFLLFFRGWCWCLGFWGCIGIFLVFRLRIIVVGFLLVVYRWLFVWIVVVGSLWGLVFLGLGIVLWCLVCRILGWILWGGLFFHILFGLLCFLGFFCL